MIGTIARKDARILYDTPTVQLVRLEHYDLGGTKLGIGCPDLDPYSIMDRQKPGFEHQTIDIFQIIEIVHCIRYLGLADFSGNVAEYPTVPDREPLWVDKM